MYELVFGVCTSIAHKYLSMVTDGTERKQVRYAAMLVGRHSLEYYDDDRAKYDKDKKCSEYVYYFLNIYTKYAHIIFQILDHNMFPMVLEKVGFVCHNA